MLPIWVHREYRAYSKALLKAILWSLEVLWKSFEGLSIGILAPYAYNWVHEASWLHPPSLIIIRPTP